MAVELDVAGKNQTFFVQNSPDNLYWINNRCPMALLLP